jgi:hypothetical protein
LSPLLLPYPILSYLLSPSIRPFFSPIYYLGSTGLKSSKRRKLQVTPSSASSSHLTRHARITFLRYLRFLFVFLYISRARLRNLWSQTFPCSNREKSCIRAMTTVHPLTILSSKTSRLLPSPQGVLHYSSESASHMPRHPLRTEEGRSMCFESLLSASIYVKLKLRIL